MKKKIEAFKLAFLKQLKDSDYIFIYSYDTILECIIIIGLRESITGNPKYNFFQFVGSDRIHIKINNVIDINYMILQKTNGFELYDITLSKYNEYEKLYCETF